MNVKSASFKIKSVWLVILEKYILCSPIHFIPFIYLISIFSIYRSTAFLLVNDRLMCSVVGQENNLKGSSDAKFTFQVV